MSWRMENVFTMAITAALVYGLFSLSHSWHSLWGLLMLANLNAPSRPDESKP